MSVINRMLRDLESRGASAPAASPSDPAVRPHPAVHSTSAAKPRRQLGLLLLGGGAAVLVAAFGDWPMALSKPLRAPAPVVVLAGAETGSAAALPAMQAPAAAANPEGASATASPSAAASFSASPVAATPAPMTARIKVATASPRSERPRVPPPAPDATPIGRDTEVSAEPGQVDKQMLPMPANQRAQTLLRQALELVATGHGRGALEKFLDALKLEPGLLSARRHAVTLQLELGQAAQAEALALQGLVLAPNEAQLNYLLARILAERGDAAGAIARLDNSHPLGGEAFGLRAGLHAQRGDFPRALSDYEHAVRLQPANSLWWLGLGVALESAGHAPQARQAYARAQSIGIERHDLNLFVDQKLATLEGMK